MNHYLVKLLDSSGEFSISVFSDNEEQARVSANCDWPDALFISVKLVMEGKPNV